MSLEPELARNEGELHGPPASGGGGIVTAVDGSPGVEPWKTDNGLRVGGSTSKARFQATLQRHAPFVGTLLIAYTVLFSALLIKTNFLPYVIDNNESFSSMVHARNILNFGIGSTLGLTDEAYGDDPAAHPYVYTHLGNFPRFYALLLYALGANSIESQILLTTATIGVVSILFGYAFFAIYFGRLFALITCLVFSTDYLLFTQWQVNTYRVWHTFFFFSSLLCVGWKFYRKLELVIIVANFACLFYFDFTFAAFVAVFSSLYAVGLHWHRWRRLIRVWVLLGLGSALGSMTLVIQLAAYLGPSALLEDLYLTYTARNMAANDPALIESIKQFYDSHNIVFWWDLVDTTALRSPGAIIGAIFSSTMVVYTPLLVLIVLFVGGGWLVASVGMRWGIAGSPGGIAAARVERAWTRYVKSRISWWPRQLIVITSSGRTLTIGPADGSRSRRSADGVLGFAGVLCIAAGWLLFLGALVRDNAYLGLPPDLTTTGENPPEVVMGAGLILATAVATCALCRVVAGEFHWWGLPFRRSVCASVLLWCMSMFLSIQYQVYPQNLRVLWFDQLEAWVPASIGRLVVASAAFLGVALAAGAADNLLGGIRAKRLSEVLRYVVCGGAAYLIVYMGLTGYVVTVYLSREAPLLVFVADVLVSVAVYASLVITLRGLRCLWLCNRRQPDWETCLRERGGLHGNDTVQSPRVHVGIAPVSLASLFAGVVLIFSSVFWLGTQKAYLQLLPPDHFAFLKMLRQPPFLGASFAVNTYAAPIAVMTGAWAYFGSDLGLPNAQRSVSLDESDDKYIWLADKNTNPAYHEPDYYLCIADQSLTNVVYRLSGSMQALPPCFQGLIAEAKSGQLAAFSNVLVAEDQGLTPNWAIVKFDWHSHVIPKLLPAPGGGFEVSGTVSQPVGFSQDIVYVAFRFAPTPDGSTSGYIMRLYTVDTSGRRLFVEEINDVSRLPVPPGYYGAIDVSVTPVSAAGDQGPEYFGGRMYIVPRMVQQPTSCFTCR